MSRRPLPTAPTTSSSAVRSARRPTRARRPKRSRRRSLLFSRREELLEQPLEMRMNRQLRAVKEHFVPARYANGGEVLDLQVADLVGLVLDVDPAEIGVGEFFREIEI